MSAPPHIVIIGTGVTALTLARTLLLSHPPLALRLTLLDKAKSAGGRLSTRYYDSGVYLEPGARVFEAASAEFVAAVQGWERSGWVRQVKGTRLAGVDQSKGGWWEGVGGLSRGIVDNLIDEIRAAGKGRVELIFDAAVASPSPASLSSPTLTFLRPTRALELVPAPSLVIHTAPSPQTALLVPALALAPAPTPATAYSKTFALLLPTLSLPSLPVYHRNPHPALTALSTGRPSPSAPADASAGLCVQSTPELLGLDYVDATDADVRSAFFRILRLSALVPLEMIEAGEKLEGRQSQVKRWKFAQVENASLPHSDVAEGHVLVLDGGNVIIAGDGTSGGRGGIEGAWKAGTRAAEVVRAWISDKQARGNL